MSGAARVARYAFAPGVTLEVAGPPGDVAQLDREYAPVRIGAAACEPALTVRFQAGSTVAVQPGRPAPVAGGHKTVRWAVALSAADDPATRAEIALAGWPRAFARSLVQGYIVEPLLSVIAAEAGQVLLPSAGIVAGDGLRILVGTSRAGKSTLAARSLAAGRAVIGDDQVLVDATGAWRPYPRRLRFYPDLRHAAPGAWAALAPRTRAVLRARGLVAALTRGFVRPSLAVDAAELGGRWDPAPRAATRVVLLERAAEVDEVSVAAGDAEQALGWAERVIGDQRRRLRAMADAAWHARLDAAAGRERELLRNAIAGLPVDVVRIPLGWPAPRAVAATERRLGLQA